VLGPEGSEEREARALNVTPCYPLTHPPTHALCSAQQGSHSVVTLRAPLPTPTPPAAVHNEILKRRPDLAEILAGPWFMDRKGEVPPGKKPYFMIPVFNYHKGYLSVNYSDNYYLLSQRHAEVPRLTPAHYEAMEVRPWKRGGGGGGGGCGLCGVCVWGGGGVFGCRR
jgi:hypothetical protein